jgi:hypothetical protein
MILDALRKKVFDKSEKLAGKWIRELPYVFWSLRTQPSRALHENTPFFMVYGSEALLPADLIFGAPRLTFESIAEAEAIGLPEIDVLEEERLNMEIQSARYQQTLRRYHDKVVRHRSFVVGDLVLRRVLTGEGRHKLSPPWEGSFVVAEVTWSDPIGSLRWTAPRWGTHGISSTSESSTLSYTSKVSRESCTL